MAVAKEHADQGESKRKGKKKEGDQDTQILQKWGTTGDLGKFAT